MHNAAGHYAEADKVATQGQLCRSCSMWYLVAALNAVVSFDQPHSKTSLVTEATSELDKRLLYYLMQKHLKVY